MGNSMCVCVQKEDIVVQCSVDMVDMFCSIDLFKHTMFHTWSIGPVVYLLSQQLVLVPKKYPLDGFCGMVTTVVFRHVVNPMKSAVVVDDNRMLNLKEMSRCQQV